MGGLGVAEVCFLWNNSIEEYFKVIKNEHLKDRVFNVKYEQLLLEPKIVLRELFKFLKLSFDDKLLSPEEFSTGNKKYDAHINNIWYTQEMFVQGYNTDNIDKWRKELGFISKFRGNVLMARNLKLLGYSVSPIYLVLQKILELFSINGIKNRFRGTIIHNMYRVIRRY